MKTEYSAFTEDMIPPAGELLARRHAADRKRLPLLPQRFEEPEVAARAVRACWEHKGASGYAALRSGELRGFLLGERSVQEWGRCGHVQQPGWALAEGERHAVLQDLYALLGEDWVRKGVFNHYVLVPAGDTEAQASLFELGFGKDGVRALLDLKAMHLPVLAQPKGIEVRIAAAGDERALGDLSDTIYRALAESPTWFPVMPEVWEDLRQGWSELATDKEWIVWMAFEGSRALGMVGIHPEAEGDAHILASPKACDLSVGATRAEARGRGLGTYLTSRALEQARADGYRICHIGWVSSNLWAARHWHRYGYQDATYRLAKRISPDVSWTRAS